MHKILNILLSFTLVCLALTSNFASNTNITSMMPVNVFAGNDTVICQASTLPLAELNATITGAVSDGYWFTQGDGFFDPGGLNNVLFSTANAYIPGPSDIVKGHFNLILVSFDPDGNGPESQAKDTVKVTLQNSPVLACHGSLNVSLGNNCTEVVTPQMLLTNPVQPYNQYIVTLTDPNGNILADDILTVNELEETVQFSVGHLCGANTCTGTLKPQDKTPPVLQCANITILCDEDSRADSLGYPVSPIATVTTQGPYNYLVTNLDACGTVDMSYSDDVQDMNCLGGLEGRIIRRWIAADAHNNSTSCTQVISIKTKGLLDVTLPSNYNDNTLPSLECNGGWPQLANGHPNPTFTGKPETDGCKYLESTYTDLTFDFCGNTYKLLRKWLIVDWCTNETIEHNQIIKIVDTTAPTFTTVDSLNLITTTYDCHTGKIKLPLISNVSDCSNVDTIFTLKDTFNTSYSSLVTRLKDTFYLDSLPVGYYLGSYIVSDECGNKDTLSFPIKVRDNKVPFAVCKQFVKISIINNGSARMYPNSLDDNSVDNCQIDSFSIAKMIDPCGNTPNTFGKYIDFCCEETANPVMAALQVTDIYGNKNTCMTEVTVEDKEKPIINCPSNITIDCEYPIDVDNLGEFGTIVSNSNLIKPFYIYDSVNNGFAGTDGLATDNCMVSYDSTHVLNVDCYEGTLIRDFVAIDLFGNKASCRQTINIVNNEPFKASDISWPDNIDIDGCDTLDLDLNITKQPTYINKNCANVESTYEDQYFYNTNEACIKILRNWTVVEWCSYDPNTNQGIYSYAQIIKLNNTIAPEVSLTCEDTLVCNISLDCSNVNYIDTLSASDDCTTLQNLKWSWEIDSNNDGTIEYTGTESVINVDLENGQYQVYVEVIDQCGNISNCDYEILVKDCKRPTPYCVSNLTTVIMPSSKQLEIKAHQFDYDSYDNCTPKENLLFSFSSDKYDSTQIITCNDISNGVADVLDITLYVTDEAGNQDFCVVELAIQDNDDVCQDVGSLTSISGKVETYNKKKVENAILFINSDVDIYNQSKLTNSQGTYTFESLPTTLTFNVRAGHQGPANEELSTFDLILLQRHILGIAPLTSPYQIIAGDANGSKKINVSDLVAIRKVILGITNNFGNDLPAWRFIDADQTFTDIKNPWNFKELIELDTLSHNNNIANFVAVKIGDINGSIGNIRSNGASNNRNNREQIIEKKSIGNTHNYSITENIDLDGFQLSIEVKDFDEITFNQKIEDHVDYFINESNVMKIVCYLPYSETMSIGESLMIIHSAETNTVSSSLTPEIYVDNEIKAIQILDVNNNSDTKTQYIDHGIKYVNGTFELSESLEEGGNIYIYDISGKLISQGVVINHKIEIKLPAGIVIVSYLSPKNSYSQKIFIQ